MHLGALLLELLDPGLHVGELVLEALDLLRVGAHRGVEGLGEQVRHGLGLLRKVGARRALAHGGRHGAVGEAAGRQRRLGLLLARVHVGLFGGLGGLLVGFLAAQVLGVVVEGLRAGRAFFNVAVGT